MLPLTTTTITVQRLESGVDPYDNHDTTWSTVTTRQPATITSPSGFSQLVGGHQQTVSATLYTDTDVDLRYEDRIIDETTNVTWQVKWVAVRYELGFGHLKAGIEHTAGAADGG
jgi:hypothetical protein